MKILKKVLVSMLVLALSLSAVACGGGGGNKEYKNMSILNVSNYGGGYGRSWIDAAIARFEAEYKEVSFDEGKKGVHIELSNNKTKAHGPALFNEIKSSPCEVFFTETVLYNEWVDRNLLLDITDVVKEVNPKDDNKTIESKILDTQKDFLQMDNKYYAIPHYFGFTGIVYDLEVYDTKQLYYAKNGAPSEPGFTEVAFTGFSGARSKGPDGEYGTDDDGLPATYDEFFVSCAYMKDERGVTPFTWTGRHKAYFNWILTALLIDCEGLEQSKLNYTFEGSAKDLITLQNGKVKRDAEPTTISNSNGYELYRQEGRYYALKFLEQVINNEYCDKSSLDDSDSNIAAQTRYLRSASKNKPIAMLTEGVWWEQEADNTGTFEEMTRVNGKQYSRANRNFGMMPLPKPTKEKVGMPSTIMDIMRSFAFIKSNIEPSQIKLAKTFLKFCYTDVSLQEFTLKSGLPKSMKYEMKDSDLKNISKFCQNVWHLFKNSECVYPFSKNEIFMFSPQTFDMPNTFKTDSKNSALDALKGKMSAEEFYNGMVTKNSELKWKEQFKDFIK